MRWAAAFRSRFAEVLPGRLGEIASLALFLLGPILALGATGIYLYGTWALIDEGLVAQGVVIGGDAGRNDAGEDYCVEQIAFEDRLGKPREARRSCAGSPQVGEKVTVRYSASNPGRTYVDGDAQFGTAVFFLGVGSLWFLSKLVWKMLKGVSAFLFSASWRI